MADEKKPSGPPTSVIWIVLILVIFVPSLFNAFSSILGGIGNAFNMQAQKSPGLIIILIIVAIVYFKKDKKEDKKEDKKSS